MIDVADFHGRMAKECKEKNEMVIFYLFLLYLLLVDEAVCQDTRANIENFRIRGKFRIKILNT